MPTVEGTAHRRLPRRGRHVRREEPPAWEEEWAPSPRLREGRNLRESPRPRRPDDRERPRPSPDTQGRRRRRSPRRRRGRPAGAESPGRQDRHTRAAREAEHRNETGDGRPPGSRRKAARRPRRPPRSDHGRRANHRSLPRHDRRVRPTGSRGRQPPRPARRGGKTGRDGCQRWPCRRERVRGFGEPAGRAQDWDRFEPVSAPLKSTVDRTVQGVNEPTGLSSPGSACHPHRPPRRSGPGDRR